MGRRSGLSFAVVVGLSLASPLAGAQVTLNSAQQQQLTKDVNSGDLVAAQGLIITTCNQPLQQSQNDKLTLDQRLASAKEAQFCFASLPSLVAAQSADPNAGQIVQPQLDLATESVQQNASANQFMGLTWGLGFGYSFGEDEAIDDAVIVDGVVRVKSRKKDQPRAVLEFHRYFWCNNGRKQLDRGCGPFFAVAASQDDALAGVGVGWMYGRRSSPTDSEGFSVGIGVILDADIKDLADGFKENQPPPGTETAVRFEEKSRWSALIMFTRTF